MHRYTIKQRYLQDNAEINSYMDRHQVRLNIVFRCAMN
jgi:hypothetical protein